jgi:transcription initiation factor IIF auxiliary subunit
LVGWQNVRDWVAREGWLGPQELRLCNRATCTGARDSEGRLRYEWTAYLEGPPSQLREIQFVQYHLPPRTFAAPVRKVTHSPEDGFALTMNGWGTFRLRATVTFKDGTTLDLTHDLEF